MFRASVIAATLALALGPHVFEQSRAVDLEAADCSRFNATYDRYPAARAVRHATLPKSVGRLDIRPDGNGGVTIEGGAGREYSITACVSAGAPNFADAQAAADSVRLRIEGNRVSATEPDVSTSHAATAGNWNVQFVIETPRGADVSAVTNNGPISLSGVSGRFDVRAQNGPISVRGSQGDITATTQNGPISIELSGRRFDGHLTAQASNGPLSIAVPEDYASGVEISSSSHAPWSCSRCTAGGSRDWSLSERLLKIGSDPVVVRVSTNNGPVSVSR
jgi:hypothetical protein